MYFPIEVQQTIQLSKYVYLTLADLIYIKETK